MQTVETAAEQEGVLTPPDDRWCYYYADLGRIVVGEVMLSFYTAEPIDDVVAYVEGLDWPESVGAVTGDNLKHSFALPRDEGYSTIVLLTFDRAFDEHTTIEMAARLCDLPFIESATPNMVVQPDASLIEPNELVAPFVLLDPADAPDTSAVARDVIPGQAGAVDDSILQRDSAREPLVLEDRLSIDTWYAFAVAQAMAEEYQAHQEDTAALYQQTVWGAFGEWDR